MKRLIGTNAMGLRAPIIKKGDDLVTIVKDVVVEASKNHEFTIQEKDIVGITESLVARAQGNYCTIEQIVEDFNNKYDEEISIVFPILSRNRFSNILRAAALTEKKIKIYLSYPSDEVGNCLMDKYKLASKNVNVYNDTLTEKEYMDIVEHPYLHPFTKIDYVDYYKSFAVNDNIEILFSNNIDYIAENAKEILIANIHEEDYLKNFFKSKGVDNVLTLKDIMNQPVGDSGYNPEYGLYGSNLSGENSLKLFPRDSKAFAYKLQEEIKKETGIEIEVLVYGDGAFKDPIGGIWELADPVVSPGYTDGLEGQPNEIKLKYLADNDLADLKGEDAIQAMKEKISSKDKESEGKEKLGTTPRQLTDLIGSLCDLVSGSGDKGTPIVYIKGYFDNYSND